MGHAKVKDKQFRVIEDVVRGRDTFRKLTKRIWEASLLRRSAMGIYLTSNLFERYEASSSQSCQKGTDRETMPQLILIFGQAARRLSPATPTRMHKEEVQAAREDPPLQVAGEQHPQRLLLPSLPCPRLPPRGTMSRGVSIPALINIPLP